MIKETFDMKDNYQNNFPSLDHQLSNKEIEGAENCEVSSKLVNLELDEAKLDKNKADQIANEKTDNDLQNNIQSESADIDNEKILLESFQCAIRFKSKEFKLPIIVSTFMKTMHACW